MRILIVKSIFAPNQKFYKDTIDSIIKLDTNLTIALKKYYNLISTDSNLNSDITIELLFIGWINRFSEELDAFIKVYPFSFNVNVKEYYLNYGKYYMFNDLRKHITNEDILIYMDHDIIFPVIDLRTMISAKNIFHHTDNEIGLISFNQKEDCRHQNDIYSNQIVLDSINLCYANSVGSIACGCFCADAQIFKVLTDFPLLSIYGFDDIVLIQKFTEQKKKSMVFRDIYAIHPFNDVKLYNEWKKEIILDIIKDRLPDYYKQIESSVNFFNSLLK